MKLSEIRPNLWLTDLHLDEFDVRGAVIVGARRVMVWDTLSHPRDMQPVMALADDKPIDVVYSHADWDHCWGTAGLRADTIIAHEACAERFRTGEVARDLAEKQAQERGQWEAVRLIAPMMTFTHSLSVDLGGVLVELHHLPGHTRDCLVAWIPAWGVLLAGDTVETPLPYLHDYSPSLLPQWIALLEGWAANPQVQSVIPAHGEIGDRSVIEHTLNYLRDLQADRPPVVPAEITAFYTETHAKNQAFARAKG
jgi:glyoxylase-like metal-dependent hydrolase (beta-lactamase superfamily II)